MTNDMSTGDLFLRSALTTFQSQKRLAERAIAQLADDQLRTPVAENTNSITVIMKHMAGNMLSRWTDFLATDGEKPWRHRDNEFVDDITSREELMALWERGWSCLMATLAGDTRLLFDAGVSGKRARERMAEHGRCPSDVDALFVSHEHGDHIRCAGVFHRMFDVPVYVTKPTLNANAWELGRLDDVRHFRAGESICIDGVTVHTFPTPHDAVDTVSFIVEFDGRRLGIFTDLGHPFRLLPELLESVDAAYLESNPDISMLEAGPYPEHLKRRIAGGGGHLSNAESADVLRRSVHRRTKWIALSHLSEENNTPETALDTHRKTVGRSLPIHVASRYSVSPTWEV